MSKKISVIKWIVWSYWLSYSVAGGALDNLTLSFDSLVGDGWQADNITLHLGIVSKQEIALTVDIGKLILPGLKRPIAKLSLNCPQGQYRAEEFACPLVNVHIADNLVDKPNVDLTFSYDLKKQELTASLEKLALAEGMLTAQVNSAATGWQAQLNIEKIAIDKLLAKLGELVDLPQMPSVNGSATLNAKFIDDSLQIDGEIQGLKYSTADGTRAGENLVAKTSWQVKSVAEPKEWQAQGMLTVTNGELYNDPIYVNIDKDKPLTLTIDAIWQPQKLLNIAHFSFTHKKVLKFEGFGEFTLDEPFTVKRLTIQTAKTSLKPFYTTYLQSWLSNGQLGDLDIDGTLTARWDKDDNTSKFVAELANINLADKKQRFSWSQLDGLIQWHNQDDLTSWLRWDGGFASKIQLGASQIQVNLRGNQIKLLAPWQQPLLGGAITIERFNLMNLGTEDMQWELNGHVQPLSLQNLSSALDLLPLQGQIAGKIPPTRYRKQHLEMAGELRAQMFEGEMIVKKLAIDNLFGATPSLKADIDLDKLNLQKLTNVTNFGEIQGQLSGYIHELHLINWQPVTFDAHFETPADNTLPKKISQRAIDNLSNLGGNNVVNAISRGILRVFENFSYTRLGWGCRLKNGICEMRGVEKAPNGYYIVKGGGLPRIDVIGYNQQVNWKVLLNRLKSVSQAHNPVIK
ncbi:MAG: hypothetical protein BWK79_08665 [Beggiatoa sp. IS2]|nr:MAG: hypothetical protein BWK79_08665 [Beggiatoa sp. IS2]